MHKWTGETTKTAGNMHKNGIVFYKEKINEAYSTMALISDYSS
jgi:hypothetical protein